MEFMEAIKGRRSIRRYKNQNIPDEAIAQLIEAATCAPSAGNIQPWEFVIARNPAVKEKLLEASYNQTAVQEAPVVIVVCADQNRSATGYGNRGKTLYCLQDTAAAVQNILLTAYSLGLGTCWIGAFNEDEAAEAVKAPKGVRPVAMIPVGYPDVTPRQRNKRPVSEMVHYDSF
jgi:nitroreductase